MTAFRYGRRGAGVVANELDDALDAAAERRTAKQKAVAKRLQRAVDDGVSGAEYLRLMEVYKRPNETRGGARRKRKP